MTKRYHIRENLTEAEINEIAAEGWELFSVTPSIRRQYGFRTATGFMQYAIGPGCVYQNEASLPTEQVIEYLFCREETGGG